MLQAATTRAAATVIPIRIESQSAADYAAWQKAPARWKWGDGTSAWSELELDMLREVYARAAVNSELRLDWLSKRLERDKANVCRKARELGLTNQRRKDLLVTKPKRMFECPIEREVHLAALRATMWDRRPHPRGALGMRHTDETRALLSRQSRARWEAMTQDEREEHTMKTIRTKREKGISIPGPGRGSWKAGWREVGDQRCYFRSRWEANYARYLEWLRSIGQIAKWEHEPHTFWFEGIRRGCVSYLPDFRVTEPGGGVRWHEVKGWMDARSKTVLARMARYHPHEVLVLIEEKQYREIKLKLSSLIPGWES